jgi:hypothetical protein
MEKERRYQGSSGKSGRTQLSALPVLLGNPMTHLQQHSLQQSVSHYQNEDSNVKYEKPPLTA